MTIFTPLYDKILVKVLTEEDLAKPVANTDSTTIDKFVLDVPDGAKEKQNFAKVIRVGTGRISNDGTLSPLTVKENDIILYKKFAGDDLELNDEKFLVMKESDVVGIISNES